MNTFIQKWSTKEKDAADKEHDKFVKEEEKALNCMEIVRKKWRGPEAPNDEVVCPA